jgi:predicted 3-demethylubiquinone-9 3-methyltransferase (glyoxalase superfamily)
MQKIIPHLWFDTNAEEAAAFYASVFRGGKVGRSSRYPETGKEVHGMKPGSVMTIEFQIEGYDFIALNGGPVFTITPAISFTIACPTKEEVDELWGKLSLGGKALMPLDAYPFSERYGWIQDKFGVSWQIIYMPEAKRCVVPSLLFVGDVAGKAEEAMKLYMSVFKNSKAGQVARYPAGMEPDKEGTIMYSDFFLEGQKFIAMDSARPEHAFTFNEGVSLLVQCKDQAEIDYFWEKLNRDQSEGQCGWIHDRFGVSWQIAAADMSEMIHTTNKEKLERVMGSMMKMKKLDLAALTKAYKG